MNAQPPRKAPIAEAFEWVSRITTVGIGMALPIVAGWYLDQRFETRFGTFVGLVVGLAFGVWQLIAIARTQPKTPTDQEQRTPPNDEPDRRRNDS